MKALPIIVLLSSIWVLFDSKSIGVKPRQIKGLFSMGPFGWFFGCLLLWIVCFPAYLLKRGELKAINEKLKQSASVDPLEQLEKLGTLREKGIINEDEFQEKKSKLMGA